MKYARRPAVPQEKTVSVLRLTKILTAQYFPFAEVKVLVTKDGKTTGGYAITRAQWQGSHFEIEVEEQT